MLRNNSARSLALRLSVATLLISATVIFSAVDHPSVAAASQSTPVDLGTSAAFSVLSSSAVTNGGASVYPGNVGVSPGSTITGIAAATVRGTINLNDPVAIQAHNDLVYAYQQAVNLPPSEMIAGDLSGRIITPGVRYAAAELGMTTTLTFDAQGDPNAYFIFQVNAAVTTAASSKMVMINGAQSSHIIWQVAGAVTLGASSSFLGTVVGNAAITIGAGSRASGRFLTKNGAITASTVTMDVSYDDPLVDSASTLEGQPVSLDVLDNDGPSAGGASFSRSALDSNPKLIGRAVGPTPGSPRSGTVNCITSGASRGTCSYQPNPSFVGTDGFDYALSQPSQHWNVHVTITVTAAQRPPAVAPDRPVVVPPTASPSTPTPSPTIPATPGAPVDPATPTVIDPESPAPSVNPADPANPSDPSMFRTEGGLTPIAGSVPFLHVSGTMQRFTTIAPATTTFAAETAIPLAPTARAATPNLAYTGADVIGEILLGIGIFCLGYLFVILGRRRRRAEDEAGIRAR